MKGSISFRYNKDGLYPRVLSGRPHECTSWGKYIARKSVLGDIVSEISEYPHDKITWNVNGIVLELISDDYTRNWINDYDWHAAEIQTWVFQIFLKIMWDKIDTGRSIAVWPCSDTEAVMHQINSIVDEALISLPYSTPHPMFLEEGSSHR